MLAVVENQIADLAGQRSGVAPDRWLLFNPMLGVADGCGSQKCGLGSIAVSAITDGHSFQSVARVQDIAKDAATPEQHNITALEITLDVCLERSRGRQSVVGVVAVQRVNVKRLSAPVEPRSTHRVTTNSDSCRRRGESDPADKLSSVQVKPATHNHSKIISADPMAR